MKGKKKKIQVCLLFAVIFILFSFFININNYKAAESMYENAKEFYFNTGFSNDKHIKIRGGTIYFGTRAKLAHTYASGGHKYYNTLGYDVTLTGGGKSLTFSVKRGGSSLSEVADSMRIDSDGYQYLLYSIPTETVIALAKLADPTNAATVLAATKINVCMDAIVTVRQNGVQGSIVEDGKGGITEYETNGPIYHLKNQWELNKMMEIFSGHKFMSYYGIEDYLYNYKLTVLYNVGPATVGNTSYGKGTYSGNANMLFQNNALYIKDAYKLMQPFEPMDPIKDLGLNYTGYHLNSNEEWKKSDGTLMSTIKDYIPEKIEPSVINGDKSMVLYANWKPNTYYVAYFANGGAGRMTKTTATYDQAFKLTKNGFSRRGYKFMGWATSENSKTVTYTDQQQVKNLTSTHMLSIPLYAVWQENILTITLDNTTPMNKKADTAGTTAYYEKYEVGNYKEKACTTAITCITKPEEPGYTFDGYYTGKNGMGTQYIDASGKILATNKTFAEHTTLFAKWKENQYIIEYDANGGIGVMEATLATYGKEISLDANTYTRRGYNFMGWSTEANGKVVYSDKHTVSNLREKDGDTITLFAIWEPIVVCIEVDAQDGSGGTQRFWQKYENGFFSSESCIGSEVMKEIFVPVRTGYTLQGFWDELSGRGTPILSPLGVFLVEQTYFLYDTTIYADWKANNYIVTFDKQLGKKGTDSIRATYDKLFPMKEETGLAVEAPIREGYRFAGYFTGESGSGKRIYNEHMASDVVYKYEKDITLYAHWIDDILPEVELNVSCDIWTNQEIELTAIARDYGKGLSSIAIYQIAEDDTETLVASVTELKGTKYKELTFINKKEGAIRYKAVAIDMMGNSVESYNVVYFDKTKPDGNIIEFSIDENFISIELDATDINIGN